MIFGVDTRAMRITFEEVFAAPGGEVRRAVRDQIPSGVPDIPFDAPVRGHVELRAVGSRIRVTGKASTDVELLCSRCLHTFVASLDTTVEEIFETRPPEGDVVRADGGALMISSSDTVIDVAEVLRQHLVLAVPFAPLCRVDCAGLCPVCGADRNVRACDCATRTTDPHLVTIENSLRGLRRPEPQSGGPPVTDPRRSA
jgi:uncharacterized protein